MATVPLVIGGLSVSASADDGVNIFNDIKVKGQIRPRYETADVKDNGVDAGKAFTARTHLVASAGLLGVKNLSATIGLQSVNNFGSNEYNDGVNDQNFDKIVDAQFAMLSEASVDYKINKTSLHAGRSQVNLDNQRFIGTVGWRQKERSYDTVYAADNSIENLNVLVAWVYGFQGVDSKPTADTNSVLLHVDYKVMDELSVTAYDYMLANIHDTMGIALSGKINASGAKLDYRAEYAIQKDNTMKMHGATANKIDADYMNLDLGANISGLLAGVNYEVLSGASGAKTAFSTPLATGHKFNGWADVFYVAGVPTGGLKDANIRLGYTAKGFGKLLAVYHKFTSETTVAGASDDLGSEMDVVYTNKIPGVNDLTGLVKYASFSKGDATNNFAASQSDKQVAWIGLDYKFATK